MRLLDVGCGWGGMVMHAAAEHGVKALGVTLSRNQADWAQAEIVRRGLQGVAEVRHLDYRDAPESEFDAISSIGLTEHIGNAQLPAYFSSLRDRLRPGGRLLNHCITQPRTPHEGHRPVHRPVRVPGRPAGGGRADRERDERRRLRDPARGEPARALRPHAGRLERQPRASTGSRRSPRSASAGPGCGGCTWPPASSGSSGTTSSCTRCWACGWATGGSPASRCAAGAAREC